MQESETSIDNYELGDKPNKAASWRKRCEAFISDSSFGGALYIFTSKSWIKRIFWALVILMAIGGFVTVTTLNIKTLLREPISTSITLTRKNELDFPAVTICNLNLLNTTTINSDVLDYLSSLFLEIVDNSNLSQCNIHAKSLASHPDYNIGWGELTTKAGNNFTQLLQKCTYDGKECTIDDFTPINTVAGQCHTFNGQNSKSKRRALGTGIRKGLLLRLLSDPQDGFSIFRDYGYRVIIHNPDEPPRTVSEGVAVALDSTAYIGMRQVTSIDNTVFSSATNCRNDVEIIDSDQDLSFSQYSSYSPNLCLLDCLYKYVVGKCGCVERMLYKPIGGQYSHCVATDLCCEIQEFFAVNETCDCPPKCTTTDYTLTVSSSTSQLDNTVGVNIYYESLIVETRETTDSYTPWSFISDIGGNTGLFIGITLLSWMELVLLVLGLIKDCCCSRPKTSKALVEAMEFTETTT